MKINIDYKFLNLGILLISFLIFVCDDGGIDVPAGNQAPVISNIPDQLIDQGGEFTPIDLDNFVADPDNADNEINWTVSNSSNVSISILNRIAEISVNDTIWIGKEGVKFTATDPNGLSGSNSVFFAVSDATSPTSPSVVINNNDQFTKSTAVSLNLSATDNVAVTEMMISNNSSFTSAVWESYATAKNWTLETGDGLVTVYVKYRDAANNESDVKSDDIYLVENSTAVYINPDTLLLSSGIEGTVTIKIFNALALSSAKLVLSFDPTKVEVTELNISTISNHILQQTGANIIVSDNSFDNTNGFIVIGALALQNNFEGVSGDGDFAKIKFRAVASDPSSTIQFSGHELFNFPIGNPPMAATNVILIGGAIIGQ